MSTDAVIMLRRIRANLKWPKHPDLHPADFVTAVRGYRHRRPAAPDRDQVRADAERAMVRYQ
jgi:hypothetical protein